MKCPICGTSLPLQSDRCPDCGYRCVVNRPQPVQPQTTQTRSAVSGVPYTPPNKSKRPRGCCCALVIVIPVMVFLLLLILGSVNYVISDFEMVVPEPGFFEDAPFEDWSSESLPAAADEGCFALVDHTLMFVADNWDGSPILRVPESIAGEPVTSIGAGCFAGCSDLTTIILPETVTMISPMAFAGCTALRGLYVPDGVTAIGAEAFAECVDLEAIHIPASVTTIAPSRSRRLLPTKVSTSILPGTTNTSRPCSRARPRSRSISQNWI